jgi:sugar phosphate isomerase/epimerase
MGMVWEVETYMLAGRHIEAEALARRALAVLAESKHRGSEAWLRYLLGDLLARHHPVDLMRAEVSYKEVLTLAQELGMRPVQAHCHLALGNFSAQVNDPSKARSELLKAAELYRLMSMPFWLSKAETALGELS